MSGSIVQLEIELVLLVDELTHAIQKMLQVETLDNPQGLTLDEYILEPNAQLNYTDEMDDSMPHMGEPIPLYTKKVLHSYREGEESDRKL